jgi:hypothetical protein
MGHGSFRFDAFNAEGSAEVARDSERLETR